MEPIAHHHDGLGLNDLITITRDERDGGRGGAASHLYHFAIGVEGDDAVGVGYLQFQRGPRDEAGSVPGITDAALIAVVLDRYEGFQAGPYRCRENALVITKIEEALHWMRHRAEERKRRGVLGKNEA